jgi:hypothetical protein
VTEEKTMRKKLVLVKSTLRSLRVKSGARAGTRSAPTNSCGDTINSCGLSRLCASTEPVTGGTNTVPTDNCTVTC